MSNGVKFDKVWQVVSDVRDKRTHVLIGNGDHLTKLAKLVNSKGNGVHLLGDQYDYRCTGWVVHKDLKDTVISKAFNNM